MNEPDMGTGFDRLFDGFEAEMMRRVVAPGADAARRAAYHRGRRNSRVAAAFTAVAAMGVGSGVTWAVTGGGGRGPEPLPSLSPSVVAPASPTPDSSPSPSTSPSTEPSAEPSTETSPTTTARRAVNLSVTGPTELRLTSAPGGGFHGKVSFIVRNDGPTPVTMLETIYDRGDSLDFESGVPSSGVNTCVYVGGATVLRCSPDGRLAVGSSLSYDLNLWSGVAATGSDQVFTLKITAMPNTGGPFSDMYEASTGNNTITVRVIVPKA